MVWDASIVQEKISVLFLATNTGLIMYISVTDKGLFDL